VVAAARKGNLPKTRSAAAGKKPMVAKKPSMKKPIVLENLRPGIPATPPPPPKKKRQITSASRSFGEELGLTEKSPSAAVENPRGGVPRTPEELAIMKAAMTGTPPKRGNSLVVVHVDGVTVYADRLDLDCDTRAMLSKGCNDSAKMRSVFFGDDGVCNWPWMKLETRTKLKKIGNAHLYVMETTAT